MALILEHPFRDLPGSWQSSSGKIARSQFNVLSLDFFAHVAALREQLPVVMPMISVPACP
jgi:hypothetical protein